MNQYEAKNPGRRIYKGLALKGFRTRKWASEQAEAARKKDEELMQRTLAALMYARDSIESWGAYASDYFATKYDLAGDIRRTEDAANALRTRLGDKHE